MAVINIEYYSEVLGMNRKVNVIYPESSKVEDFTQTDIPVLYLLHGMSGNENSWIIRSGIERLIRHTNLAIVMPSTDLGFYVNTTYGMNYFDAKDKLYSYLTELTNQIEAEIFSQTIENR